MPIPHWLDRPSLWNRMMIGAVPAPGIVVDVSPKREFKSDEQDPSGYNSGTIVKRGEKVSEVSVKVKLWTREHLKECEAFLAKIFNEKSSTAYDCSHPILTLHRLRSMHVLDVDGPSLPDQEGLSYLTFKLKRNSPPKPAVKPKKRSEPVEHDTGTVYYSRPQAGGKPSWIKEWLGQGEPGSGGAWQREWLNDEREQSNEAKREAFDWLPEEPPEPKP